MTLHKSVLTEAAASSLASGGSPFLWQRIKDDIRASRAHVFQHTNGSFLVLGIQRPDLVCYAMTGCDANDVTHDLVELAKANNCDFIRFVTKHKGFPRLLRDFELQNHGTIYRIKTYEPNS